MENVVNAIKSLRVGKIFDEYALQNQIADKLNICGIEYKKECQLGTGSRVDFLTEKGVAIEVKKGKPNRTKLEIQINRYAVFNEVTSIIIVVETSLRIPITKTMNGKPCAVLGLQKLWGIAL